MSGSIAYTSARKGGKRNRQPPIAAQRISQHARRRAHRSQRAAARAFVTDVVRYQGSIVCPHRVAERATHSMIYGAGKPPSGKPIRDILLEQIRIDLKPG